MCNDGCYAGANVICGTEMTAREVFEEIKSDIPYYANDGGVTISGGEPMAQKEFTNEIIDVCKENGVRCAIETSLLYYDESVFRKLDFIMADFKIWNSNLHKEYTGVSNEIIIENFIKLNTLDIPIIARTPVIPEINKEIDKISEFLKTLNNVVEYELLPYHPLGVAKQKAIGKAGVTEFTVPTKEYMQEVGRYAYIR